MRLLLCLAAAIAVFKGARACAGIISYAPGRASLSPPVNVAVSTNRGASWRQSVLKPGTSVSWPANATNLNVNGMPLDPAKNYRVKEGNISEK